MPENRNRQEQFLMSLDEANICESETSQTVKELDLKSPKRVLQNRYSEFSSPTNY